MNAATCWLCTQPATCRSNSFCSIERRNLDAAGESAGAPGATDAERAAWLADKIVAGGDYAKEAAAMLRRWPSGAPACGGGLTVCNKPDCGMRIVGVPASRDTVTAEQARIALDNMDDYARMGGIVPSGAFQVLRKFIEQNTPAGVALPARRDEGEAVKLLERIERNPENMTRDTLLRQDVRRVLSGAAGVLASDPDRFIGGAAGEATYGVPGTPEASADTARLNRLEALFASGDVKPWAEFMTRVAQVGFRSAIDGVAPSGGETVCPHTPAAGKLLP